MSRIESLKSQVSVERNSARKSVHTSYIIPTNTNGGVKTISSKKSLKPTKSILSTKSSAFTKTMKSATSSGSITHSTGSSTYKRAHFDKHNLDLTYKPYPKEYGSIKITHADTPYPRKTPPVPSAPLTPHCSKLFNEEKRRSIVVPLPRPFCCTSFDNPLEMDFITKRKIFHKGEYTLTRQRRPMVVHPPLESIQLNTHNSTSHIPLTEFFRKHYRQRHESLLFKLN